MDLRDGYWGLISTHEIVVEGKLIKVSLKYMLITIIHNNQHWLCFYLVRDPCCDDAPGNVGEWWMK